LPGHARDQLRFRGANEQEVEEALVVARIDREGHVKITYDREVHALYIRFKETTVPTHHLAEGIAADYDADGRLAGIEIPEARKRLGQQTS
jgi:YD repeat-containing protein